MAREGGRRDCRTLSSLEALAAEEGEVENEKTAACASTDRDCSVSSFSSPRDKRPLL